MWSAAQAEGVDFDDQRAINVWLEEFNRVRLFCRELTDRAVLGVVGG